jgi:DNA replication protein DnaC
MTSLGCQKIESKCETHGSYESSVIQIGRKQIMGVCPECASNQNIIDSAAIKQQTYDRNIRLAGVPPRYAEKGFDAFKAKTAAQHHALKVCQAYVSKFNERFKQGGGLILCGKPGTGKTHLSVAIVVVGR